MNSNAQAVMSTTMAYEICMNNQMAGIPDSVFEIQSAADSIVKSSGQRKSLIDSLKNSSIRLLKVMKKISGK